MREKTLLQQHGSPDPTQHLDWTCNKILLRIIILGSASSFDLVFDLFGSCHFSTSSGVEKTSKAPTSKAKKVDRGQSRSE
mmetsp:Transcript_18731/g.43154  ORF Transcript_18731/g.43154 Transcript_18731/m.43154 type:complete len:80 (+) Transcript_18731:811-1050(+)